MKKLLSSTRKTGLCLILVAAGFFFAMYAFFFQKRPVYGHLGYFFPSRGTLSAYVDFDDRGIVLIDYGGAIGLQYNPASISRYALENYNLYIESGQKKYRDAFFLHVDWLLDSQVVKFGKSGVWLYRFDYPKYGCSEPWISAMAQGLAMSALCRAYLLSGRKNYLEAAERAVDVFYRSVDKGGVRFLDAEDNVFFLEYPCERKSFKLNGFIFSLLGLHDLFIATEKQKYLDLFSEGIKTLKARLADYDSGDWSYTNLEGEKASQTYHRLHCTLLFRLHSLTRDPVFLHYAQKWAAYFES